METPAPYEKSPDVPVRKRNRHLWWIILLAFCLSPPGWLLIGMGYYCLVIHQNPFVEPVQFSLNIAPGGRRAALSTLSGNSLLLVDLFTGTQTSLKPSLPVPVIDGPHYSFPSYSPDGRTLAFAAASDLWLCESDGSQVRRVTNEVNYSEREPSFSSDGKHLVFVRAENNPFSPTGVFWIHYDIWVCRTDGTDLRQLTNQKYQKVSRPHYSRDGRTVLFAAEIGNGFGGVKKAGIWSVGADTPTASPRYIPPDLLLPSRSYLSDVDLSAKQNLLVFVYDANHDYDYAFYVVALPSVTAKGSPMQNAHRLARAPSTPAASLTCPTFTPDASTIYYLAVGSPDKQQETQAELWKVKPDGFPPTRIPGIYQ